MPKPLLSHRPTRARDGERPRPASLNPDILVRLTPTLRDPFGLVVVATHHPNWDSSADLLDETEAHLSLLGNLTSNGAWFLNPCFTVSSRTVSAEFFRAARHARSQWLKEVRQSISLRREARAVSAHGRRVALVEIDRADSEAPSFNLSDLPRSTLSAEQRLEVLSAGHLARQMAFSGLMIIDGDHVLPRTWNQMADELLGPEPPARKSAHRRPATRSTPEAPRT